MLNSTSQRREAGKSAIASTNSGRSSIPGRKTRKTGRRGSARNDSASTPAQPASPVRACQARAMAARPVARGAREVPPARIRGSPSQAVLEEPGLAQQPGGPAFRPLLGLQDDMMGILVGPPRVVQARRADPREDVEQMVADRQPDVDVGDRVERGRRVAGRIDGLDRR